MRFERFDYNPSIFLLHCIIIYSCFPTCEEGQRTVWNHIAISTKELCWMIKCLSGPASCCFLQIKSKQRSSMANSDSSVPYRKSTNRTLQAIHLSLFLTFKGRLVDGGSLRSLTSGNLIPSPGQVLRSHFPHTFKLISTSIVQLFCTPIVSKHTHTAWLY